MSNRNYEELARNKTDYFISNRERLNYCRMQNTGVPPRMSGFRWISLSVILPSEVVGIALPLSSRTAAVVPRTQLDVAELPRRSPVSSREQ